MDEKDFPIYNEQNASRKEKISSRIYAILATIVITVVGIILISRMVFYSIYSYSTILGCSMSPTINPDVYVGMKDENGKTLDSRKVSQDGAFFRKTKNITRGDMFVLEVPNLNDDGKTGMVIKRAIATEGDKVTIRKYDGLYRVAIIKAGTQEIEILDEEYITSQVRWDWTFLRYNNQAPVHYNGADYEGSFYSLYIGGGYGTQVDRLTTVHDSRYGDTVFFNVQEGEIFYLGDNRVYSADSRDPEKGLGKVKDVRGVVEVVIHGELNKPDSVNMWWKKVCAAFSHIFGKISEFFAWNS